MDVAFFCPGNKCEVRESGLCSLPGVNMSKVGHAPEMCFLKHLYIEYLTSSRPGDLNQVGNHRQFPRARHFCSLSMMGNVAHAELHHGKKLHYCTLQLWMPPGQHEPPFTLRQLTASVKLSDGAMIEGYKTATTPIFNWFSFFQTATFFPHPPRHQCLGWDKEECFLLSRGRGKGYLVYQ